MNVVLIFSDLRNSINPKK